MLKPAEDYDALYRNFRWQVPKRYNIARDICDDWADRDPSRPAIIYDVGNGDPIIHSYGDLQVRSNQLANALKAKGIKPGDRVMLLLPQRPETAISHIALYKLGAIALPVASLFGVDAISYRLDFSSTKAIITDASGIAKLEEMKQWPETLKLIVSVDGAANGVEDFNAFVEAARDDFNPVDTDADDPALMIFTSGTTGPPKGALHAHRVLLGHIPGFQMLHEFFPQEGDLMWTPADWAWAGGLLNAFMTSLRFGIPIVAASRIKFDPDWAFDMMARHRIRNAFIPPTALKFMRAVKNPSERYAIDMRTILTGGEALGAETYEWGQSALGLKINETYGQTECNLVIASCNKIGLGRGDAMGKAAPGHRVAVIDDDGTIAAPGEVGQIAVARPDPVMFLEYWNNPEATSKKFIGDWMITGDQGAMDEEGYFIFFGRDDDVITSNGYRIGPGEIEDCLLSHPAVALAAAVGKPDPVRTEIIKVYLTLQDDYRPSDKLAADIQTYVRERLAAHETPREVAFVDAMPMTTTGKVIRRILRDEARGEVESPLT